MPPVETKRGAPIIALVLAAILGGAIVQSPRIAEGGVVDCNDDYFIFRTLSKGDGFLGLSGGDFIAIPLEYALTTTVASYSDLETISTARPDTFDRSEWQWKEVAGSYTISDLEEDRNSGEGQVFNLKAARAENLLNSMRSALNVMFFAAGGGNAGKDVDGFQHIISTTPTTGTVGGINRGNFSFHRNQQTSGAQTTSAFDNLRAAGRSIYNLCSNGFAMKHPTASVTTRTVFEGFEGLLLANERFTDKEDGEGAFKNEVLKFKGTKMSYDNDCPSGNWYFYSPEFLKLAYKKGSWMKMGPAVRPANQTAEVRLVRSMCQLVSPNCRRLGVVSGIS